jgi:hypothetical protein
MKKVSNGHLIFEPKDPHPNLHKEVNCVICDGGLAVCSVCGKGEVELDQPCSKMSNWQETVLTVHQVTTTPMTLTRNDKACH